MNERATFGDFVLGLEGLGILRSWLLDPATVVARRDSISRVLSRFEEAPWSDPIVSPERSVGAGYAEWAAAYDGGGYGLLLAEEPAVRALLARRPPGIAIDAACGTGRHAAHLGSLGHDVIGIDSTPAMLAVARARVPAARFAIADLEALPIADGAADMAVCALALSHCAELGPPMSELARVVRVGGSVIVTDVHPFTVMLGGHGEYPLGETARAFVRNYVHLPADYLRALVDDLGLRNVQVVEERGELFAADGDEGRERYACAMGRALAKLPVALEILLPLVRVGGLAAVFAGPGAARWMPDAARVAAELGAEPPAAQAVTWPGAPLQLSMVTCRKSSRTPGRFPRAMRRMRRELPKPP